MEDQNKRQSHEKPGIQPSKNMKFQIRLLATTVSAILVLFIYCNIDFLVQNQITSMFSQRGILAADNHRIVKFQQSCQDLKSSQAETDVDTHDLLHELDTNYKEDGDLNYRPKKAKNQNVQIENREKTLHIIVLPNTHSDPGWLKTVDGYFQDSTKATLDLVVEKLMEYPNMTFIWPETVFLSMWWDVVDAETRDNFKKLVRSKRLEIVTGGWVQPDEATTHYFALIDQMIEGHQWLSNNIGVKPINAWSTDNFGYSPSMAYLYKKAGFKTMAILRIHAAMKAHMQQNKQMEFYWRQQWDGEGVNDLFTEVLPYNLLSIADQCGPDKHICELFNFKEIGKNGYYKSGPETISKTNVLKFAYMLLGQYIKKNSLFKHNVVLVSIGCDFTFDNSDEWDQQYGNYQKLFDYMNSHWNVKARFGTLQDYYQQVEKEKLEDISLSFPTFQGDFLPYSDGSYWTGFYSTRSYDKRLEKELETCLRTAEIFHVIAQGFDGGHRTNTEYNKHRKLLEIARRNLALFQHHDGITGTSRELVVEDYEQRLYRGISASQKVLENSVRYLIAKNRTLLHHKDSIPKFKSGEGNSFQLLNPENNIVNVTKDNNHSIVLCNPSTQYREDVIRLTVRHDHLEVYNQHGKPVLSQINPLWNSSDAKLKPGLYQLVFLAELGPLSLVRYTVTVPSHKQVVTSNFPAVLTFINLSDNTVSLPAKFIQEKPSLEKRRILENKFLRATFSSQSGSLQTLTTKSNNRTSRINVELLLYESDAGAYIFEAYTHATNREMLKSPPVIIMKGPVVNEIFVFQSKGICWHSVSLYNSGNLLGTVLEINNIADMSSWDNRNLIMRFNTDIIGKSPSFYTDLNGMSTIKRTKFSKFPIAANYYPMTSFAYLEDQTRVSVLSAQSLGVGGHIEGKGSLEVMLDRRLRFDDGKGLDQGVLDSKRTASRFFILVENKLGTSVKDKKSSNSSTISELGDDYMEIASHGVENEDVLSFPSLHSHQLVQLLQRYTLVLHQATSKIDGSGLISNEIRKEFQAVNKPFPCDTELVNLRSIFSGNVSKIDRDSAMAALVLHKVGYDCSFPMGSFVCSQSSPSIVPSIMFRELKFKAFVKTSLTLLYDFENVTLGKPLKIRSMDFETYRIRITSKINDFIIK